MHYYLVVPLHCCWLAGLHDCIVAGLSCYTAAGLHDYMRAWLHCGVAFAAPGHKRIGERPGLVAHWRLFLAAKSWALGCGFWNDAPGQNVWANTKNGRNGGRNRIPMDRSAGQFPEAEFTISLQDFHRKCAPRWIQREPGMAGYRKAKFPEFVPAQQPQADSAIPLTIKRRCFYYFPWRFRSEMCSKSDGPANGANRITPPKNLPF